MTTTQLLAAWAAATWGAFVLIGLVVLVWEMRRAPYWIEPGDLHPPGRITPAPFHLGGTSTHGEDAS
jgi:hypothetical protein